MNDNEIQAKKFLNWINRNYEEQKSKLKAFCADKNYEWDEDIFCDTYLKIYDKILKDKLKDDSDAGFDGYFFMSFKINTIRSKQYASVTKRDGNVINLNGAYEEYSNNNKLTEREKLLSDLFKDYATLYLLKKAEDNFDGEHFYLFRLKTFDNMTYRELAERTGIKGVRQKVVNVKNWLKGNVSKEEIKKSFEEDYGDLLI